MSSNGETFVRRFMKFGQFVLNLKWMKTQTDRHAQYGILITFPFFLSKGSKTNCKASEHTNEYNNDVAERTCEVTD